MVVIDAVNVPDLAAVDQGQAFDVRFIKCRGGSFHQAGIVRFSIIFPHNSGCGYDPYAEPSIFSYAGVRCASLQIE
jgi:hypothetical protein